MVVELNKTNSIANRFLAELRDVEVQKDPLRFRRNLERMGEVMAYELSRTLEYAESEVVSPLGVARVSLPVDQPVLCTILRAGLPLHQGMLNYFDRADNAFVSAYRKHRKGEDGFDVEVEYLSSPSIDGRVLVISCLLYTSPSPRDRTRSRMPSSACKTKNTKKKNTYTHNTYTYTACD